SHDKDIASRTEPWFKEWISYQSPPDNVRRTDEEIDNDEIADEELADDFEWLERAPPVAGEDNEERLVRERRLPQRVLDQDYRALRNQYLDNEVRDEDTTEIREYMQGTIWPVAEPLVEAILYRQVLHRNLLKYRVTPLGNVYASAQVSPFPSYPLRSEESVRGVTIVDDGDFAAYRPGVEAAISNQVSIMNTLLPRVIHDFRPELLKINNAVRPINFDDVFSHKNEANPALRFPQALLLGDFRYLKNLKQVLVSRLGRYGVMDILHQGSAIPTSHLQFMEVVINRQDTRNAISIAFEHDDLVPSLAQITNRMHRITNWRTFKSMSDLYEQKVQGVIHQSIVVAFAALGMLGHLDTYLPGPTDGNTPYANRKDEQNLAILVADRTGQLGFIEKILEWDTGFSDDEACRLKGSGLYLGWEPRTERVKDLVQRCESSNPSLAFKNDLPVYIGADDKLYFLTYDSMVTTEPTTLQ
ncbi:hypothetical protein IWQ60_006457, partial [Tieghemiomyces parasiticus]